MSIIKIDKDTYFSTDDGVVVSRENAARLIEKAAIKRRNLVVDEKFVVIDGQDIRTINLSLLARNQRIPPQKGFLITVYLVDPNSGAFTRLYKNSITDPANQSIARGSYEDYIDLELDIQ